MYPLFAVQYQNFLKANCGLTVTDKIQVARSRKAYCFAHVIVGLNLGSQAEVEIGGGVLKFGLDQDVPLEPRNFQLPIFKGHFGKKKAPIFKDFVEI